MKTIKPIKLAGHDTDLEGKIAFSDMPRLQEMLVEPNGEASYNLLFTCTSGGKRVVEGRICAPVVLQCQRCNQPVTVELEVSSHLQVVLNDTQAQNTQKGYEPLLLNETGTVALAQLIEDEILLALPMIAKHEQGQCSAPLPDYLH